jgi:hypothetical protein
MKKLDDGTTVPDRVWYYILDWKDRNHLRFCQFLGHTHLVKINLQSLTQHKISTLFALIASEDFRALTGSENNGLVMQFGRPANVIAQTADTITGADGSVNKISKRGMDTGFEPGSPNDEAARLAAHG